MRILAFSIVFLLILSNCPLPRVSAFSYSCAGAGCSIDASGCSANPYTGQSGCACSYAGSEVVCTQPANRQSARPLNDQSGSTLPSEGTDRVQNPLSVNSLCGLIQIVLQAAIAIGIPIAVLFIVFAGFKFVVAMGNPTKLQEARVNLLYTLIGIGLFLSAWLFAELIANTIRGFQTGDNNSSISSCT